jgi:CBS domain-containing protein
VTLGDVASDEVVVGYADELVGHLADRMAAHDVGRVPVVDHKTRHVVGLVARRDLLRVRAKLVGEEHERRKLLTIAG